MNIQQLRERYWFDGGAIRSFHLDMQKNTAELEMLVKMHMNEILSGSGQIEERDLVPCTIRITFQDLIEISLFDKFPTQGYYLKFTSSEINGVEVGVSFNIHDNASYTYEEDNWVIKAKRVTWKQV